MEETLPNPTDTSLLACGGGSGSGLRAQFALEIATAMVTNLQAGSGTTVGDVATGSVQLADALLAALRVPPSPDCGKWQFANFWPDD